MKIENACLIIGAPKCGTTALHQFLSNHPELSVGKSKELDFFSDHYDRGMEWYRSFFPRSSCSFTILDASPGYLASNLAPHRIKKHILNPKFVVLLRDPIERAESQYYFGIQRGTDLVYPSFEKFILDESDPWRNRTIELGLYGKQLEYWYSIFESSRFLIYDQSFLRKSPQKVVDEICSFLKLRPLHMKHEENSSETGNEAEAKTITRTSYVRQPRIYNLLRTISRRLKLEAIARPLRDTVRQKFFSENKPQLSSNTVSYLRRIYKEDNLLLRRLPGTAMLPLWNLMNEDR